MQDEIPLCLRHSCSINAIGTTPADYAFSLWCATAVLWLHNAQWADVISVYKNTWRKSLWQRLASTGHIQTQQAGFRRGKLCSEYKTKLNYCLVDNVAWTWQHFPPHANLSSLSLFVESQRKPTKTPPAKLLHYPLQSTLWLPHSLWHSSATRLHSQNKSPRIIFHTLLQHGTKLLDGFCSLGYVLLGLDFIIYKECNYVFFIRSCIWMLSMPRNHT